MWSMTSTDIEFNWDGACNFIPPDIAAALSPRRMRRPSRMVRAILAEGGNAIEAMIAMAASIAAVYPHMTMSAATVSG